MMLKQPGMYLQCMFHVTSLLFDNDVPSCFEIVNHDFASFIVNTSDFSSDVCLEFFQSCGRRLVDSVLSETLQVKVLRTEVR